VEGRNRQRKLVLDNSLDQTMTNFLKMSVNLLLINQVKKNQSKIKPVKNNDFHNLKILDEES